MLLHAATFDKRTEQSQVRQSKAKESLKRVAAGWSISHSQLALALASALALALALALRSGLWPNPLLSHFDKLDDCWQMPASRLGLSNVWKV